ncbi:hypothetical protein, partial [Staphylococcus epidermidis]|uniref:hypothetical protein n=1 Tax=Staphylococcus epidermidis TaxID=1282 RepID=UPI001643230A
LPLIHNATTNNQIDPILTDRTQSINPITPHTSIKTNPKNDIHIKPPHNKIKIQTINHPTDEEIQQANPKIQQP